MKLFTPHPLSHLSNIFVCAQNLSKRFVSCTPVLRCCMVQFQQMDPAPRSVTWEAPEHHHVEKGNDWFFALAIIIAALVIVAILFNDVLFALLIGLAGGALMISAAKRPSIIPYGVTVRGVRVGEQFYPHATLESYAIDEDDPKGPQLLIKSSRKIMPLIVIPIPTPHIDDIEDILKEKLVEEDLEEPLFVKILELFGF